MNVASLERLMNNTRQPETWQTVKAVLDSAIDTPSTQRAALLDAACGCDLGLRDEVESLLANEAEALGDFLERPVFSLHRRERSES
jgi:hypothetical protein